MNYVKRLGVIAMWVAGALGCVEATSTDYARSNEQVGVGGSDSLEGGSDTGDSSHETDGTLGDTGPSDSYFDTGPSDSGPSDSFGDSFFDTGPSDSSGDTGSAADSDTPLASDSDIDSGQDTAPLSTDTPGTIDTGGDTQETGSSDPGVETESETDTGSGSSGGGVQVGGASWYFAPKVNVSCATVCEGRGGYDEATKSFAGSGGSNENCDAVLGALGAPVTITEVSNTVPGSVGVGCAFLPSLIMRVRDELATTADAVNSYARRACACRE